MAALGYAPLHSIAEDEESGSSGGEEDARRFSAGRHAGDTGQAQDNVAPELAADSNDLDASLAYSSAHVAPSFEHFDAMYEDDDDDEEEEEEEEEMDEEEEEEPAHGYYDTRPDARAPVAGGSENSSVGAGDERAVTPVSDAAREEAEFSDDEVDDGDVPTPSRRHSSFVSTMLEDEEEDDEEEGGDEGAAGDRGDHAEDDESSVSSSESEGSAATGDDGALLAGTPSQLARSQLRPLDVSVAEDVQAPTLPATPGAGRAPGGRSANMSPAAVAAAAMRRSVRLHAAATAFGDALLAAKARPGSGGAHATVSGSSGGEPPGASSSLHPTDRADSGVGTVDAEAPARSASAGGEAGAEPAAVHVGARSSDLDDMDALLIEEEDEDDEAEHAAMEMEEPPWECIDAVVRGAPLLKFGRQGVPHFRHFAVDLDCRFLTWQTHKKKDAESRVCLPTCHLVQGQGSDVFRRQLRPDLEDVSFSLVYSDPRRPAKTRTLDVACKHRDEYDAWITALSYLIVTRPPDAMLQPRKESLWKDVGLAAGGGKRKRGKMNISRDLQNRMKDTNDVYTFGQNSWGQLGHEDEQPYAVPTLCSALLGKAIRAVACGAQHTLALADGGECYAFGNGGSGRLGTGSTHHELSPRLLIMPGAKREPFRFRSVAAGDLHSAAVSMQGRAYSWGCSALGQTGHGSRQDVLLPTPVPAFAALAFAQGSGAGMARASSRSLWSLASHAPEASASVRSSASAAASPLRRMDSAMLRTLRSGEAEVAGLDVCQVSCASVSAGACFTAWVDTTGRLFTCGAADAPLGHDRTLIHKLAALPGGVRVQPPQASAPPPPPPPPAASISPLTAGPAPAVAASPTAAGITPLMAAVVQSALQTYAPESLAQVAAAAALGGGSAATVGCMLASPTSSFRLSTPPVFSCPSEASAAGAQAAGGDCTVPLQVVVDLAAPRRQVLSVSCGYLHAAALTSDGKCWTWGWNATGALGLGDLHDRVLPTHVSALPAAVSSVACGATHTLALVTEGGAPSTARRVYAWGSVTHGQVPADVPPPAGDADWPEDASAIPLPLDAPAYCITPQCVDLPLLSAPSMSSPPPSQLPSAVSGQSAFASPVGHSSASPLMGESPEVSTSATLTSGSNTAMAPATVPCAIAAGATHSAVLCEDGTLYMFGEGSEGQLGVSSTTFAEAWKRARKAKARGAGRDVGSSKGRRWGLSSLVDVSSDGAPPQSQSQQADMLGGVSSLRYLMAPASSFLSSRGSNAGASGSSPSVQGGTRGSSSGGTPPPPPPPGQSAGDGASPRPTVVRNASASFSGEATGEAGVNRTRAASTSSVSSMLTPTNVRTPRGASHSGFGASALEAQSLWRRQAESVPSIASVRFGARNTRAPRSTATPAASALAGGEHAVDFRPRSLVLTSTYTPARKGWAYDWFNHTFGSVTANGAASSASGGGGSEDGGAPDGGASHSERTPGAADIPSVRASRPAVVVPAHALDIYRPASPTRVCEYRVGTYGAPAEDVDALALLDDIDALLGDEKPATKSAPTAGSTLQAGQHSSAHAVAASHVSSGSGLTRSQTAPGGGLLASSASAAQLFSPARSMLNMGGLVSGGGGGGGGSGSGSGVEAAGNALALPSHAHSGTAGGSGGGGGVPLFIKSATFGVDAPLRDTLCTGPLHVPLLARKEVRTVSCGLGYTVCTVATEWMRNEETTSCMRCEALFTVTRRRHHCRNCGGIFCDRCSSHKLPLLKLGHIEPVRVCDGCYARLLNS